VDITSNGVIKGRCACLLKRSEKLLGLLEKEFINLHRKVTSSGQIIRPLNFGR